MGDSSANHTFRRWALGWDFASERIGRRKIAGSHVSVATVAQGDRRFAYRGVRTVLLDRGIGGSKTIVMKVATTNSKFIRLSIEKALKDLPALPEVVAKVLRETEKPDCTAASIERLMASDQAITAKVLRVVNSAYYGLSGQVSNLGQAIVILGVRQVRNLVLSVGAMSAIQPKTQRQQDMLKQFWLHSFGTAAATQILGQHRRMSKADLEILFVGGIMHDIGKLFLFCNFTEAYDDVAAYAWERKIPVVDAEQKLLGITHCEIGRKISERWLLPTELIQMIGEHEGPFGVDAAPQVYVIHVADVLTHYLYYSEAQLAEHATVEAVFPPIDNEVLNWMDLSHEELRAITTVTDGKVSDAASILGLVAA